MNRSVIEVEPTDIETIKAIFKIHDEILLAWNPNHSVSAEYSAGVLERVQPNIKNGPYRRYGLHFFHAKWIRYVTRKYV